ncbi:enoyl-CoA hydratase/isomerase family protein [Pseudonocardia sp. GCM10023141]|uniref:enoyl-CoA hydratase/isomerase family protein n=1 Tax=Pseudonocardia sp. GCM10023141 TaxID=3252653 RepID=UPI003621BA15
MIERVNDGDVAVLTLNHGAVSALDIELCQALAEQFRALAGDPARAVVLTGTGRAFSAGVDLRKLVDGGPSYVEEFLPALSQAFRAMFALPKPMVAAVNGHAIAGGCVLAACADATIMADGNGRVGLPETRVGVPFPRVPLEIVRFAVGDVTARRLVVGGQTYPVADARTLGLVDEIVAADELLPRAVAVAAALATDIPADTFAVTKAQLRRDAVERIDRYVDEDESIAEIWSSRVADGWIAEYLASVTRK